MKQRYLEITRDFVKRHPSCYFCETIQGLHHFGPWHYALPYCSFCGKDQRPNQGWRLAWLLIRTGDLWRLFWAWP